MENSDKPKVKISQTRTPNAQTSLLEVNLNSVNVSGDIIFTGNIPTPL